jgi:PD-(D/E)XK nuclease superfamily
MGATEPRPAWRCEGCGKLSNRAARPRHHVRGGEHCGPFKAAQIAPDGMVLAPAGAVVMAPAADGSDPQLRYRQSTLRSYVACPRSTVLSSHLTTGTVGSRADLGSAFHATAAEILRTLRRQGEVQISTEEAVCVMREVVAAGPWVLSAQDYNGDGDRPGLVQMVCNFAGETWNPARFMAIEQRLSMEIPCPDGEIRLLTGTPDLVVADPDTQLPGIVVIDHKTGMARPQSPRVTPEDGEPIRGAQYLTDGSFTQFAIYSVLAFNEWPGTQRFIGREKSWRWLGPWREVTITREEAQEHLTPWVAELMMKLDRGRTEGEGSEHAQPRPNAGCATRCPVKRSCPVPQEQRGVGAITSPEEADAEARRWAVIKALDPEMRAALKTYHEESGYAPQVTDGLVVRWRDRASGKGREFGIFSPAEAEATTAEEGDAAYMAQWAAELERRTGVVA